MNREGKDSWTGVSVPLYRQHHIVQSDYELLDACYTPHSSYAERLCGERLHEYLRQTSDETEIVNLDKISTISQIKRRTIERDNDRLQLLSKGLVVCKEKTYVSLVASSIASRPEV